MNRVILTGRTTADLTLRHTQSGTAYAGFTLAVSRRNRDEGTDFITCTVWGKTAEVMEKYVKKGYKVGITGRIHTGNYEKDGKKIYTWDVVVEEFEFLETKKKEEPKTETEGFEKDPMVELEDLLPF